MSIKNYMFNLYNRMTNNNDQNEINLLKNYNKDNTEFFSFNNQVIIAKVISCYDGDTITCIFRHNGGFYKFKVRMDGYDSPEMKPAKTIPDEERKEIIKNAHDAKNYLERLILNNYVYLYCKKFDKYGRLLADVKISKNDLKTVNQLMIDNKYGYVYHGGKKKELNNTESDSE